MPNGLFIFLLLLHMAVETTPDEYNIEEKGSCKLSEEKNYQIVLYEPPPIIPSLCAAQRVFSFAGKEWVISQQWNEIGVAAVVWEAALALSHYLESLGSSVLADKRIIELGAGTGLVGMVASALGACTVVLTDRHTASAEVNLETNRHNLNDRQITVSRLEWGQDVTAFNPPFDVILAADVVYIEESFPLLIKSLSDLSNLETIILFSSKHRYERDDRFYDLLHAKFESKLMWSEQTLKIYTLTKISSDDHAP